MNTIMKRKIELIGHLLIHNEFIIIIMEGKINDKRTRGRPSKSFFEEIFCWIGFSSYKQIKRIACVKYEWL